MKYRSIFMSDLHLGTRGCNHENIMNFLRNNSADTWYLVGDIIDGWRLSRRWFWPQEHNDIIQKILRFVRKGAKVIYIPGNHDEFLRDYCGSNFGGIDIVGEAQHTTIDGKRLLIVHGDKWDEITKHHKWLAIAGDCAYNFLLLSNNWVSWVRRKAGYGHWSAAHYAKQQVKKTINNFISNFEEAASHECRHRGFDGVLCGHIHHGTIEQMMGCVYFNTGDGVESCTAVVEDFNGGLELICYRETTQVLASYRDGVVTPRED
jgi:UDP-2,3-diacylglucosamine pyrophosphatase LpxH